MIKELPKEFREIISQNNGMSQYLDNLSQGRAFTPRSWLYENEEPDKILADWMTILSTLENGDTFEKKVYQFDTLQLEKWGPQGGIAPMDDLLEEYVEPTFKGYSPSQGFSTWMWEIAVERVRRDYRKFGIHSLLPVTYKHVVDDMRARDTLISNSGWPLFTRRNKPEVIRASIADAQNGKWAQYPAIALFRNYNLKTRLVWMFPMATNVFEGSFVQSMQNAILNSPASHDFYCPWRGFEEVRSIITRAYDLKGKCYIYASDFSKTDQHFTWSATKAAALALMPLWRNKDDCLRMMASLQRMHNIPLIISESQYITGEHGVASGSNWTNFIETVFDHCFGYYVGNFMFERGLYTDVSGLYGIGDDMAWISDEWHDDFPKHLAEAGKTVGQELNAEKVSADPDAVKTLQRLFQRDYRRPDGYLRGVYPTIRALKSSIFPERFHKPNTWSSDMFCARQYMILENCVDHPLFEEFVKFVVKGQKDLIPFAKKSSSDLQRIQRETKLLPGFNPTYNQEKRDSSLSNFASIDIARKL